MRCTAGAHNTRRAWSIVVAITPQPRLPRPFFFPAHTSRHALPTTPSQRPHATSTPAWRCPARPATAATAGAPTTSRAAHLTSEPAFCRRFALVPPPGSGHAFVMRSIELPGSPRCPGALPPATHLRSMNLVVAYKRSTIYLGAPWVINATETPPQVARQCLGWVLPGGGNGWSVLTSVLLLVTLPFTDRFRQLCGIWLMPLLTKADTMPLNPTPTPPPKLNCMPTRPPLSRMITTTNTACNVTASIPLHPL